MKVLKIIFFTAMAVFGVFGICCLLYPTVSNQINESCNESTINEYNSNVNTSSESAIQAAFERAEHYNEVIAADYFSEEISEYETVLNDYYLVIAQTKQRLKLLKEQKKKLEKQIQEEESARLMSVLADFGIKTIDDFEHFMDNKDLFQGANAPQPTEE